MSSSTICSEKGVVGNLTAIVGQVQKNNSLQILGPAHEMFRSCLVLAFGCPPLDPGPMLGGRPGHRHECTGADLAAPGQGSADSKHHSGGEHSEDFPL